MVDTKKARPNGQLIPIFTANQGCEQPQLIARLGRLAVKGEQKVLIIDGLQGAVSRELDCRPELSMSDILFRGADIDNAIYPTAQSGLSVLCTEAALLSQALGIFAALSMVYDWVFIAAPAGCTPAHVRLANGADKSLLLYHSGGDAFMQAFWMIDAIRRRDQSFDPHLLCTGPKEPANEAALLLLHSLQEYLGTDSPHIGHQADRWIEQKIMQHLEDYTYEVPAVEPAIKVPA